MIGKATAVLRQQASSAASRPLLIVGFAIALAVVVRLPWLGGPFTMDEPAAMTVGREMTFGHLPNVTAWQQRHPGTYLFYGAAALLPFSPDMQLDILAIAAVVATVAGLGFWLRNRVSRPAAAFGLVAYALISSDLSTHGQTANTELIINALLTFAAVRVAHYLEHPERWSTLVLAGLLVGLSGTIKEHTVLFLFAMAVVVARLPGGRFSLRPPLALLFGAALPWVGIVVVYSAAGELPMVIETFAFNASHVQLPLKDLLAGPILLASAGVGVFVGSWPLWIMAVLGVGAFSVGSRGPHAVTVAYLLAAAGMIILPGYYFAHYYLLALPAVIVMSAYYLDAVASSLGAQLAFAVAWGVLTYLGAIQLAFATNHIPWAVRKLIFTNEQTVAQRAFSRALGEKCEGSTLLLYGVDHQFHMYSGLRPAQPILWLSNFDVTRFRQPDRGALPFLHRVMRSLAARPPDLILLQKEVSAAGPGPVGAYIHHLSRDYEPLPYGVVLNDGGTYEGIAVTGLYRRRGGHSCAAVGLPRQRGGTGVSLVKPFSVANVNPGIRSP